MKAMEASSQAQCLNDARQNREQYVRLLMKKTDRELEKRLDVIREQIYRAHREGLAESIPMLDEWESQVIEARVRKPDEKPQRTRKAGKPSTPKTRTQKGAALFS